MDSTNNLSSFFSFFTVQKKEEAEEAEDEDEDETRETSSPRKNSSVDHGSTSQKFPPAKNARLYSKKYSTSKYSPNSRYDAGNRYDSSNSRHKVSMGSYNNIPYVSSYPNYHPHRRDHLNHRPYQKRFTNEGPSGFNNARHLIKSPKRGNHNSYTSRPPYHASSSSSSSKRRFIEPRSPDRSMNASDKRPRYNSNVGKYDTIQTNGFHEKFNKNKFYNNKLNNKFNNHFSASSYHRPPPPPPSEMTWHRGDKTLPRVNIQYHSHNHSSYHRYSHDEDGGDLRRVIRHNRHHSRRSSRSGSKESSIERYFDEGYFDLRRRINRKHRVVLKNVVVIMTDISHLLPSDLENDSVNDNELQIFNLEKYPELLKLSPTIFKRRRTISAGCAIRTRKVSSYSSEVSSSTRDSSHINTHLPNHLHVDTNAEMTERVHNNKVRYLEESLQQSVREDNPREEQSNKQSNKPTEDGESESRSSNMDLGDSSSDESEVFLPPIRAGSSIGNGSTKHFNGHHKNLVSNQGHPTSLERNSNVESQLSSSEITSLPYIYKTSYDQHSSNVKDITKNSENSSSYLLKLEEGNEKKIEIKQNGHASPIRNGTAQTDDEALSVKTPNESKNIPYMQTHIMGQSFSYISNNGNGFHVEPNGKEEVAGNTDFTITTRDVERPKNVFSPIPDEGNTRSLEISNNKDAYVEKAKNVFSPISYEGITGSLEVHNNKKTESSQIDSLKKVNTEYKRAILLEVKKFLLLILFCF